MCQVTVRVCVRGPAPAAALLALSAASGSSVVVRRCTDMHVVADETLYIS